ncbi:hypothetical protein AVEN_147093-1 [Araneus ventricosus]|uniref:Uncharacterized protein n=1 Tax=Araneus ventricosus TaxID=182803 RepID=A0A4Y2E4E8_ARAVE|nr:hypothetical protein AVEN_147093-1 [Araneus ventricosus]
MLTTSTLCLNGHWLSAKAFPRKPFRKPLPQGLHRKAFYDLPHRQGLNDESAKAFPRKLFRKPLPKGLHRKAFHELPHRQANLSAYLAERFNPCHGNLCDNPLPLPTTRFPKPFRQAFFAIWAYPWGYAKDQLEERELKIGTGGHQNIKD